MIIFSAAHAHAAPKLLRARAAVALSAPTTSPPPLFEPRDAISLAYLSFGVGFTAINCVGAYGRYDEVCGAALAIGCVSAAAICADAVDPPPCPAIDGPGYVDRRTISRFGAAYMLGAMWVCWRTGPFWPADAGGALAAADPLLCLAAAAAFVYGLVAPTASLLSAAEREFLTPDRQNLLVGSVVQNVIGATFLPVVLCLAFRGEPWWLEVHERWPYQTLLEPSTSTFAGLCVDGGLLLLRLAARERLSWTQVVVGGVSTSVVLAVVPCACFLAYNDGLFDWWSLYSIKL